MADQYPSVLVAMFAIGIGVSFLAADPRSPTSRALSASVILVGVVIFTYVAGHLGLLTFDPLFWIRAHGIAEAAGLVAGFEWILRIGKTTCGPCGRFGERLTRAAQGLAVLYGVFGVAAPEARAATIDAPEWHSGFFSMPEYWLFAIPFWGAFLLPNVRLFELLRSDLDESERVRLVAFMISVPFFVLGLIVPTKWGPIAIAIGEILFLAGAVRYHVLQGQRGQFLARFLSPQVAELVREQGLSRTLEQNRLQLSVVACDLRGFTAFSETSAPEEVMQLLGEYYSLLGKVVTKYGGTIKDLAGDGMLALVGAPLAVPDHAERSLRLASELRRELTQMVDHWRSLGRDLGFGIGVASGFVTVGAISGAGRFEYAAVGPAVNLAARLCDRAETGTILVDQRTVGLVGDDVAEGVLQRLDAIELKGVARPVTVYAVVGDFTGSAGSGTASNERTSTGSSAGGDHSGGNAARGSVLVPS